MTTRSKNADLLNDLIRINNDRSEGYKKAAKVIDGKENGLRDLFEDLAAESTKYAADLQKYVMSEGVSPANGSTAMGKVYRVWMDLKTTFSGNDRKSILEACEYGEDAAQKAYEEALNSDADLSDAEMKIIRNQQKSLQDSHNYIKTLRDRMKVS